MKKLFPVFVFLALLSCGSPNEDKAEISEPAEVKVSEPEALYYQLKISSSEVNWTGSKPTGKHTGTIGIKEGNVQVLNGKVTGGKVIVEMKDIEVRDLKSDEDSHMKLTEHLKSDDFFDVANHPYAKFEIIEVKPYKASDKDIYNQNSQNLPTGEKPDPTHEVTGNFTMRGKTLSITFPAYIDVTEEKVTATAKFVIDRTLWDVRYNEESKFKDKAQDKLIFNDVVVGFNILAHSTDEIPGN